MKMILKVIYFTFWNIQWKWVVGSISIKRGFSSAFELCIMQPWEGHKNSSVNCPDDKINLMNLLY